MRRGWAIRITSELNRPTTHLEPLEDHIDLLRRQRVCRCFLVRQWGDQCRDQNVQHPPPQPRHDVKLDLVRQGDCESRELHRESGIHQFGNDKAINSDHAHVCVKVIQKWNEARFEVLV
jgi:hypothetical protein